MRKAYHLSREVSAEDLRAVSDFYSRADAAIDAAEAEGEPLLPPLAGAGIEEERGGTPGASDSATMVSAEEAMVNTPTAVAAVAAVAERCRIWESHGVALIRLAGESPVGEPRKNNRRERREAARKVLSRLVDAGERACGRNAVAAAERWV